MAPIKFDKHIKDKLEERRVQPSNQAWDTLAERLDSDKNNTTSKPYWWLGVAASIIGILFMISQFFTDEIKIEVSPKVVETPVLIKQDLNNQIANEVDKNDIIKTKEVQKVDKIVNSTKLKINTIDETIAINNTEIVNKKENDIVGKPLKNITENSTFEEQQIKDVVAKVKAMETDNKTITNADIDALLQQAQKEIRLYKLLNEATGLVNANALLQDVEADINQSSFRNRVFEALKSNFTTVANAVVQRNN